MPRMIEITVEQEAQVRELWTEGALRDEIARRLGLTVDEFNSIRKRLELPARPRYGSRLHVPPPPTEAEIAERAAEIRSRWSPEEAAERAGYRPLGGEGGGDCARPYRIVPISEIAGGWD